MKPLRFVALLLLLAGCRAPTEIEVTLRTDLPCTDKARWKGVDVYVGEPGAALEKQEPTFHSDECNASGLIGSVIVVPSGADDARVGVRVVASTEDVPEKCRDSAYAGCVVARRSLRFRPHQTVPLDIELAGQCVRVACDAESTCLAGTCVGTGEVAPTEPELPEPPPEDKRVRCGDNGVFCPTEGNVCCLTVDIAVPAKPTHGECKPRTECPTTSIVLNCDDFTDCASDLDGDGSPALCMLDYEHTNSNWGNPDRVSSSYCIRMSDYVPTAHAGVGLALCQDRTPCPRVGDNVLSCQLGDPGVGGNALPEYSWCLFNAANEE